MAAQVNPVFTRSEKRRVRRKIAHKAKSAARGLMGRIFGIPLSPGLGGRKAAPRRHRRTAPIAPSGVWGDVVSALTNQGYKRGQAERMVPQPQTGEGFDSLFRRAVKRNPGELVIFGNPEKVYTRLQVGKCRQRNLLPAAVIQGLGFGAGEAVAAEALAGRRRRRQNATCGTNVCFHGAYKQKAAAVAKEGTRPGSFTKNLRYGPGDYRWAVMTRQNNPIPKQLRDYALKHSLNLRMGWDLAGKHRFFELVGRDGRAISRTTSTPSGAMAVMREHVRRLGRNPDRLMEEIRTRRKAEVPAVRRALKAAGYKASVKHGRGTGSHWIDIQIHGEAFTGETNRRVLEIAARAAGRDLSRPHDDSIAVNFDPRPNPKPRSDKSQGSWYPASGGSETPFTTRTGRRLLYVWQPSTGRHAYLDTKTDIILSDDEASAALGNPRRRTAAAPGQLAIDFRPRPMSERHPSHPSAIRSLPPEERMNRAIAEATAAGREIESEFTLSGYSRTQAAAIREEIRRVADKWQVPANELRNEVLFTFRSNPRQRSVPDAAIRLSSAELRRRNMAFEWMADNVSEYASAQMLAQAASTKYDFPVSGLIETARQIFSTRKGNPGNGSLGKARDLFRRFHHRDESGVFELQRSAKLRKDYTILGPLVAIGVNAEKFDQIRPRSNDVVDHWDKLPHLAFLTSSQVDQVKSILGDPEKYVKDVAVLASSPNGRQLYVLDPTPSQIDLSRFDCDAQKDYVDLGEATFVVYIAKKPHEAAEWVHILGEEGGARPRLNYSRLAKELFFTGGSYRVEAPGIIN